MMPRRFRWESNFLTKPVERPKRSSTPGRVASPRSQTSRMRIRFSPPICPAQPRFAPGAGTAGTRKGEGGDLRRATCDGRGSRMPEDRKDNQAHAEARRTRRGGENRELREFRQFRAVRREGGGGEGAVATSRECNAQGRQGGGGGGKPPT